MLKKLLHWSSHLESYPPGQNMAKRYVRVWRLWTWYIQLSKLIYIYEHGTYTFMNVNICMDVVQTDCTASQQHFTSHQARSALHCQRVSAPLKLCSFRAASFLSSVFLTDSTTQEWLARPNCHSHVFTSYILLQCWPSAAAVSQLPRGKPELLCWLKIISLHLWTGTAPILIHNCKRDIPQFWFCISVLATKTC